MLHYIIFVLLRHKNEVKDIKEAYVQFIENGNVIIQHRFKYLQKLPIQVKSEKNDFIPGLINIFVYYSIYHNISCR